MGIKYQSRRLNGIMDSARKVANKVGSEKVRGCAETFFGIAAPIVVIGTELYLFGEASAYEKLPVAVLSLPISAGIIFAGLDIAKDGIRRIRGAPIKPGQYVPGIFEAGYC